MVYTLRLTVEDNPPGVVVEVPAHVVDALGAGKRPAIRTVVEGVEYRTRIAVYGGRYLIGFRRDIRAAAALVPGQEVELTLELDAEPREIQLPPDLAAALQADPDAQAAFDQLAFTNRKEFVDWVQAARRPATRQRRVADATTLLRSGRRTPASR